MLDFDKSLISILQMETVNTIIFSSTSVFLESAAVTAALRRYRAVVFMVPRKQNLFYTESM